MSLTMLINDSLKEFIEFFPIAVIAINENDHIFVTNKAACQMPNYSEKEILSKSIHEFIHPHIKETTKAIPSINLKKSGYHGEAKLIGKNKKNTNIILNAVRISKDIKLVFCTDITKQKKIEENLIESNQLLNSIIENTDQYILINNADKKAIKYNSAYAIFMKDVFNVEMKPGIQAYELIKNKKIANWWNKQHERVLSGEKFREEFTHKFGSEESRVYATYFTPIIEHGEVKGFTEFIRDITKLKKGSEQFLYTKALLEAVLEQSPVPMVIVSYPDMKIRMYNKACEEFLGAEDEEKQIGKSLLDLKRSWQDLELDSNPINLSDTPLFKALNGIRTEGREYMVRRKDGTIRYGTVDGVPIYNDEGELIAGYIIFPDITKRKVAEIELKRKNEELLLAEEKLKAKNEELTVINQSLENSLKELGIAKKKAEESDKLKSSFLANMSHEIRTPLNSILGFSELLYSENLTFEKKKSYLDIIYSSGVQLLTVINDIIDISKMESNQLDIFYKECDLNKLLDPIKSEFELAKNRKNKKNIAIKLTGKLPASKSITITDCVRLKQILSNLINNALKYTNEGSVEFGYSLNDENFLQFYVKDTGMGISEENKSIVFDQFRQADITEKKVLGGTGLGLTISKGLVELLGGKIWFESKENIGSTFYFTIPYKKPEKQKPEKKTSKKNIDLSDKTILVVDDHDDVHSYFQATLKNTNCELLHARSGLDAIQICSENKKIGLVLLDIQLPDMNGFEVIKSVQKINNNLPIIAQTAYALTGDREKALAAGCKAYISKPIDKILLYEIISTIFTKKTS